MFFGYLFLCIINSAPSYYPTTTLPGTPALFRHRPRPNPDGTGTVQNRLKHQASRHRHRSKHVFDQHLPGTALFCPNQAEYKHMLIKSPYPTVTTGSITVRNYTTHHAPHPSDKSQPIYIPSRGGASASSGFEQWRGFRRCFSPTIYPPEASSRGGYSPSMSSTPDIVTDTSSVASWRVSWLKWA